MTIKIWDAIKTVNIHLRIIAVPIQVDYRPTHNYEYTIITLDTISTTSIAISCGL